MRAVVIDRPGSFRVADLPDPTPRAGEVVVRVDCCGICGTDLHILAGEFPPTPYPIIPGHEFAAGTPLATVEAEVRNAIVWYKTPNMFFDQVPTSGSNVPYYLILYRYVHGLGGMVMLDPGTVPPPCYMPASDVLQVFTGTQAGFQSVTFPSWLARYPPNRFAAVLSGGTRSGIGTDIVDAAKDRIGNVYVNDEIGTPTFGTLPGFCPAEVSDVKAKA